MKPKDWGDLIRLCVLGALNGLLFGVAIEMLRVWRREVEIDSYLAYQRANPNGIIADFDQPTFNVVTPLLCAIIFAGSCHVVHRFYKHRPRSVLLLWQVIGLVAATVCAVLNATNTFLPEAFWGWVACLAVVVPINFIYGIILESSVHFYTRGHDC
jgi:hypothetical protein